ncbi:diguanylate cyclase (GGDEF)-like protein [Hydrogenivirga caldilitoris]|uniref:diguanylate cyclase n=1 Tax=Hydrogenivirga caldilitoris TaxID=246264 RepID=A0A497XNV9_9AQUI|nr:diguanylate cyclase [Hydrogenivirga caldilitoris]RLJ70635.1 diguanylate cyclase (GGDEF)-like protein [Hydrogenivirga caldilitoris]
MKTYNLLYKQEGDVTRFVEEKGIEDTPRLLVQVFTGVPERRYIENLQRELEKLFNKAGVIGTSTGGEIFNGEVYENSTVLSFTVFERAWVKTALVEGADALRTGRELVGRILDEDTKLMIIFADGLNTNGDDLIDAINEEAQSVPVVGGLAGDNFTFKGTYVFTSRDVTDRGVVGASVNTDKLQISTHYNLAWVPVGKGMVVTRTAGNRIYEIEGKPVVEVYKSYLGAEAEELLPYVAIEFPLVLERDGVMLARACLGIAEDGSMLYTGVIKEGEKVRFSIWDTGVMLDSAAENLKKFRSNPSESVFVYTCLARKYLIGGEAEVESKHLQSVSPTSGFMTYGEFYNLDGKNRFMNYTFTAVSLSEREFTQNSEGQELEEEPGRDLIRFRALVSLVNTITGELKDANDKLERLAERDPLTGLYNRRKMIALLEEQIRRTERYGKSFCVLMVDIDNFKLINDTYGHQKGDEVLKGMAQALRELLRSTDLYSRWGGEEFLVVMPETEIEGGTAVAEKLRVGVRGFFNRKLGMDISVSVGLTAYRDGDCIEGLLSRADRAMYRAKKKGKNLVVVS